MIRFVASSLAALILVGCVRLDPITDELGSATDLRVEFERFPAGGRAELTELYENGDAWVERWRVVESAQDTLDVVYFIVSHDPFGLAFLGQLQQKAAQGVQIRLMIDHNGVLNLSDPRISADEFLALDRFANVEVRTYNPLSRAIAEAVESQNPIALAAQNHDKMIVADGARGVIGGRNIADEYFGDPIDDPHAFHDKDVRIDGARALRGFVDAFDREWRDPASIRLSAIREPSRDRTEALSLAYRMMRDHLRGEPLSVEQRRAIAAAAPPPRAEVPTSYGKQPKEQIRAWLKRHPHLRGALHRAPTPPVEGEVRVLDSCSAAGCDANQINGALARLLEAAQEEVVVENPYLVLTDGGLQALERAAKRGVKITLLTNSPVSSDNAFTQAIFLEQYPTLLARVPTLRLFVAGDGHNIHGKVAIVDRKVTVIGSYNLDFMSSLVNSEVVAAVWSEEFASRSRAHVLAKIAAGQPHVFEYRVARDDDGAPILKDGAPVVAFGAEDHCTPSRWTKLHVTRSLLQLRRGMPNGSPLL